RRSGGPSAHDNAGWLFLLLALEEAAAFRADALPARRSVRPQVLLFLRRHRRRDDQLQVRDDVAPPPPVEARHPAAAQHQRLPGLRAGGDLDLAVAVQRRNVDRVAERELRKAE